MAVLPLTGNALHNVEMEYHGKFGHYLGRIYNISPMDIIGIFYTAYRLVTQNLETTLPGFQIIKRCIQYLDSHPHKTIFYPSNYYDGSNVIILTWNGDQVEYHTTPNCL